MRQQAPVAALAVLFLAAHLLLLPRSLEDIDSINFALGVRAFDVAAHQPHPPGHPVFIALAKLSTGALRALGVASPEPRGLALLSALSGAALVPLLFLLYRRVAGDARVAWWGMALAVTAPLFWFTALRPLSDTTGLAFAVAAQVLLIPALARFRESPPPAAPAIAGAALAGLAAGVRVQTVMLTAPLLLAVLVWPSGGLPWRHRAGALAAAVAGGFAWGVPLVAVSGGLGDYLAALGTQAGEDFAGVVMLWTTPHPRVAADALLYTFLWPWGTIWLGAAVVTAATAGVMVAAWRAPRMVALLAVGFAPYAAFHLLFHETITIRYALPLVVPLAVLAAYGAAAAGRVVLAVTCGALVAAALTLTMPATRAYARDGSPAVRLFRAAAEAAPVAGRPAPGALGFHAVMRRVQEWERPDHPRLLRAPHGREWLALVEHWRREPEATIRFLADPRRTDLALFDPHARTLDASARWTLPELPFVAGTRPGPADAYTMSPPGWMLDRGWALTAEIGGITAREGLGPHVRPSVAWARARADAAALVVGGRHLGGEGAPAARITLTAGDRTLDAWEVGPGFFFRHVALPAGALAGTGYLPLAVGAAPAQPSGPAPVALEQFDLQPDGTVMLGYVDGWQEPEYSPRTARAWRWMSERARLWVRPVGRDLTLTISGESPLRYFDRAPTLRITAAGGEIAQLTLSGDFTEGVRLPAKALALSGGLVVLESDLWFSPAERSGSPDRRHLALRIYSVSVR